ncbi:MAG: hypothetical protein AAF676_05740 [Pseudomonadota bacterium]
MVGDSGSENVDVELTVPGEADGVVELVNHDGSEFKPTPNGSATSFGGRLKRDDCCTDGLMVGVLDGSAWSLPFELTRNAANAGSAGWAFVDGAGGSSPLALPNDRAIRISPVPMPAGVPLIGSAFALTGTASRFSAKA